MISLYLVPQEDEQFPNLIPVNGKVSSFSSVAQIHVIIVVIVQ